MSPDTGLLTLADIARHFSLPESTARYYCKRFAVFLPAAGQGRRRRYHRQTLEIISFILNSMSTARNAAAVEEELNRRFPRTTETRPSQPPSSPADVTPRSDPHSAASRSDPHGEEPRSNPHATSLPQDFFPSSVLALLNHQIQLMERMTELLEKLTSRATPDTCGQPGTRPLDREMQALQMRIDATERMQQADLEQLRTWLGRIIRLQKKIS